MHGNTNFEASEPKILDYWIRRRQGLTEAEWIDFYQLVVPVLMRTRLPSDYNNAAKRKDLVNLFFAEKIFLNASTSKAGPLRKAYALHEYLKRFEIDLRREEETDEEPLENEEFPAMASGLAHARLLAEAGIDARQATHSADVFIDELEDGEAAYLRQNSCVEDDEAKTIKSIAERWAMGSSYHYKAKVLGITRVKGETYDTYGETKIGRWLLSTGVKLQMEWQEEIAVLLTLLCQRVYMNNKGAA